ncbi:MAG: hypothetical protein MI810_20630 [Flavobacteriales bacterium]|nr:hypothetical protein [Flavobacteriales bacterium]
MSQVSVQSIEKAIEKIDSLNDEALDKLIETFTLKQEQLVSYLLQAGVEYENEELNVFSIYYFAIVLEAFLNEGLQLKEISEEDIDNFQDPFLLALDAIHKEEDYEPMQDLTRQHHLMQFMMHEIEAADEDGEVLDEETKLQLFIVSSGMIGLMNQAITK